MPNVGEETVNVFRAIKSKFKVDKSPSIQGDYQIPPTTPSKDSLELNGKAETKAPKKKRSVFSLFKKKSPSEVKTNTVPLSQVQNSANHYQSPYGHHAYSQSAPNLPTQVQYARGVGMQHGYTYPPMQGSPATGQIPFAGYNPGLIARQASVHGYPRPSESSVPQHTAEDGLPFYGDQHHSRPVDHRTYDHRNDPNYIQAQNTAEHTRNENLCETTGMSYNLRNDEMIPGQKSFDNISEFTPERYDRTYAKSTSDLSSFEMPKGLNHKESEFKPEIIDSNKTFDFDDIITNSAAYKGHSLKDDASSLKSAHSESSQESSLSASTQDTKLTSASTLFGKTPQQEDMDKLFKTISSKSLTGENPTKDVEALNTLLQKHPELQDINAGTSKEISRRINNLDLGQEHLDLLKGSLKPEHSKEVYSSGSNGYALTDHTGAKFSEDESFQSTTNRVNLENSVVDVKQRQQELEQRQLIDHHIETFGHEGANRQLNDEWLQKRKQQIAHANVPTQDTDAAWSKLYNEPKLTPLQELQQSLRNQQ